MAGVARRVQWVIKNNRSMQHTYLRLTYTHYDKI